MTTRKPLFNRPAWASSSKARDSTIDEEPVFGRQRIYQDILQLERREKAERERKAKEKAYDEQVDVPKAKKRRISKEDGDAGSASDASVRSKPRKRSQTPGTADHKPVTRGTPRKERLSTGLDDVKKRSPKHSSEATIITLGDGDSDDEITRIKAVNATSRPKSTSKASPAKPRVKDPQLDDSEEEDDPYLQELKQKARERQRLQQLNVEKEIPKPFPTPAVDLHTPTPAPEETPFDADFADLEAPINKDKSAQPPSASPADDPEISIYIKPLIPNTKALIVGRKASQTLEQVKNFWSKKQGLTGAEAAKVFFVWRDIQLYNSSTMRSFVERMKKEAKPGQDDSKGQIIIHAVTREIFDHQQQEKARRAAAEAAAEEGGIDDEVLSPPPEPEKSNKFILKLQSKEYGEMALRVRPSSKVETMTQGFLMQNKPDTTKTCYLIFDGERLEAEQTVEDVGLEEGDVVEVQFR